MLSFLNKNGVVLGLALFFSVSSGLSSVWASGFLENDASNNAFTKMKAKIQGLEDDLMKDGNYNPFLEPLAKMTELKERRENDEELYKHYRRRFFYYILFFPYSL